MDNPKQLIFKKALTTYTYTTLWKLVSTLSSAMLLEYWSLPNQVADVE
jgi:hypothetical protein